jgi:EpsI family protein
VCYPAQGFQVTSNRKGTLETELGGIPVKRLETNLSQNRFEPITYWTTIGSQVLTGGATKKIAEMRYGLKGEIPDGLLFRISSIDRNPEIAFAVQQQFVNQLVTAIPADVRPRIAGL